MRSGSVIALAIGLLMAGCIPPGVRTDGSVTNTPQLADPAVVMATDEAPVWIARPVSVQSTTSAGGSYTVVAGDTLSAVGQRTGVGADLLTKINGLSAPFILKPGQILKVPSGHIHTVVAGDSGIAIARAYGMPWAQIVDANLLVAPYVLNVGQRLLIPNVATTPAQTAEQRAAAFRIDIDDILTGGEPASNAAPMSSADSSLTKPLPPTRSVADPATFSGRFIWPAQGRIASRFGAAGAGEINDGIDIAVAQGAPVLASSDGVVAFAGNNVGGYGGTILIRHGDGWISAYGRVATTKVTRGQSVKRGQTIGSAGVGAAPMLHFELRKGRTPIDPVKQLPGR